MLVQWAPLGAWYGESMQLLLEDEESRSIDYAKWHKSNRNTSGTLCFCSTWCSQLAAVHELSDALSEEISHHSSPISLRACCDIVRFAYKGHYKLACHMHFDFGVSIDWLWLPLIPNTLHSQCRSPGSFLSIEIWCFQCVPFIFLNSMFVGLANQHLGEVHLKFKGLVRLNLY